MLRILARARMHPLQSTPHREPPTADRLAPGNKVGQLVVTVYCSDSASLNVCGSLFNHPAMRARGRERRACPALRVKMTIAWNAFRHGVGSICCASHRAHAIISAEWFSV